MCEADKQLNEFSVGRDTLVIGSGSRLTYTIIHKGSYRLIKQGSLLPAQSISENWIATYDENKQVLMESKRGKIISFDPAKKFFLVGSSPYEKIKGIVRNKFQRMNHQARRFFALTQI